MCVCACDKCCVSDLSVRKLVTGTTGNEEIWDDVEKYCCISFHVKLDPVSLSFQCFSSEFKSNPVVVLWFMVRLG